jgi:hypothetical protein
MWPAFPASDYYEGSAPPRDHQPTVGLPLTTGMACRCTGAVTDGSHVHHVPVDRIDAQLCPGSIVTPTPQAFSVTSAPGYVSRHRSRLLLSEVDVHCIPAHIRQI